MKKIATYVTLLLLSITCVFGALLTDINDPRIWQGATIGTFAKLLSVDKTDSPANRQKLIDDELLDDNILTADLSQTGTLVPTAWALGRSTSACSGFSHNSGYSYTCSAGKSIFELANQIDAYWFQSSATVGNTIWDLGVDAPQAAIFVTIDHGPLPLEVIESTHYLSNSLSGPWEQTSVVRVYLQGYLLDDVTGNTNLYDGFTYVVRHPTQNSFRYISSIHGGAGALQSDGDDEINGVAALDLSFVPIRPPFNICMNISTEVSNVRQQINPILLSGRWSSTGELNYGYDLATRRGGARGTPSPRTNTLMAFFSQDYQNIFNFNIMIDSNDGSAGTATVRISTTGFGANANIIVYDDPPAASPSTLDPLDIYQWFPSTGQGEFNWSWGPTTTDGISIGPLDIAALDKGFSITIEIISSTGLSEFVLMTQATPDTVTPISLPLSGPATIVRDSCSCGNGILDPLEQCDGQVCCSNKCKIKLGGTICRPSTGGFCDFDERCDGVALTCPPDVNLTGNDCNPFCPPGYYGTACLSADCSYWKNCSSCSAVNQCGWCCSTGQCLAGASNGPTLGTCSGWQFGGCSCTPACAAGGGTCVCGKCLCEVGRAGSTCSLYLGCDGVEYASPDLLPFVDACGVCKGDNTTCLGCDLIPFGKKYDQCGVCGGDGQSCAEICPGENCQDCLGNPPGACHWCKSQSKCYDALHSFDCDSWIEAPAENCDKVLGDLTVAEAAGLGAGIIAALVIGAVAAIVIAAVGGKKGYDAFIKHQNNMSGAQSNPMYLDNGRTGVSPFYEMTSK